MDYEKKSNILPGDIVADTSLNLDAAVFGIVLPKHVFLKHFEEQKGPWPIGERYDDAAFNKYGSNIPFSVNGVKKSHSYSSDDTQIILPVEDFVSDEDLIGVKHFGEPFIPTLERRLGFEILTTNLRSFDTDHLESIHFAINHTGNKLYNTLMYEAGFDMATVLEYFRGRFFEKQLESIKRNNVNAARWVELLRECQFPEAYAGMKVNRRLAMESS